VERAAEQEVDRRPGRNAIGVPGSTSPEQRATTPTTGEGAAPGSRWGDPPAPPATREELAEVAPIVAAAIAARTVEGKPIQIWPGPATNGFVKELRRRSPAELLLQYVVGVARGEGPEAESARGGRMPLAFAADRIEYFASLGRRVLGEELAADVAEVLARGPDLEPDTPDVAGAGGLSPAEHYAAYLASLKP